MELLGPAVFQYLVNIEKARTPQHDARNVLEPTEGFGRASCLLLLSGKMWKLSKVIPVIQQRPLLFPGLTIRIRSPASGRRCGSSFSARCNRWRKCWKPNYRPSWKRRSALNFDLYNVDLAGRAQSFQKLVAGGMDLAKAAGLAGLMEGGGRSMKLPSSELYLELDLLRNCCCLRCLDSGRAVMALVELLVGLHLPGVARDGLGL